MVAILVNYQAYLLIQSRRYLDARRIVQDFFTDTLAAPRWVMGEMYLRRGFIESRRGDIEAMRLSYRHAQRYGEALATGYADYALLGSTYELQARRHFIEADSLLSSILSGNPSPDVRAHALLRRGVGMLGQCDAILPWKRKHCDEGKGAVWAEEAAALFDSLGNAFYAGHSAITAARLRAAIGQKDLAILRTRSALLAFQQAGSTSDIKEADGLLAQLGESTWSALDVDWRAMRRWGLIAIALGALVAGLWKMLPYLALLGGFVRVQPPDKAPDPGTIERGVIYVPIAGSQHKTLPLFVEMFPGGGADLDQVAPKLRAIREYVDVSQFVEHTQFQAPYRWHIIGGGYDFVVEGICPLEDILPPGIILNREEDDE